MLVPDFPFGYDEFLADPAGTGTVPESAYGQEVAVIGAGLAGVVTAYELMKKGLKPVIYESAEIGGRMRTGKFQGAEGVVADLGAMRFPISGRSFYHYVDKVGLETAPFPNPLAPNTPSTVIDLKGATHYAETIDDLPEFYREVADSWNEALKEGANFTKLQDAIRERDTATIKNIWNELVPHLDEVSFYGFLAQSEAFRSKPYSYREAFGQVGFGTGGWDTDFPNSILEILRVVSTECDDHQRRIIGGAQQLPVRLWKRAAENIVHWPEGTSLESLHNGSPMPGVARLDRLGPEQIAVTDKWGTKRIYPAVVVTCQPWLLSARMQTDEKLFSQETWMAMDRSHFMLSSKTFVMVDRPFWRDIDPKTGRNTMSMTLTDRMTRGTYLMDEGPDKPGVICLSYTWMDDALKWLSVPIDDRVRMMLDSLKNIYPDVDIASHIIGEPITVSWESDPNFMGAFNGNLPGHYRYQERLFSHFIQDELPDDEKGIFLAGDGISWTAAWAEGAVTTGLNAVWGVTRQFGGSTTPENPGPGDRFEELRPLRMPI
ncbi:NAD(P)/FAD-dependent oxidoreductase [Saxibacter everestensis]|uniref:NAD(P)/FAD-dependent oxidoreductase n=1 Tax=Saxibacter everestensis TaxID=2909229 RepID=A0ABY8R0P6_9MICO|nr:NAD(P)/FAD-dependent oxidoreductase [Brevibacteriaceae bacterium ZFBP1038]